MPDSKGYIRNEDDKGSVNISEDVIAVIAATATVEIEGVHSLFHASGREVAGTLSKKGLSRGVKLIIDGDDVTIDLYVIAEMGYSVSEVGAEIQRGVMSAVEAAVGISVKAVNINICGISLKSKSKTHD